MRFDELTPEQQMAKQYSSTMDSVTLINKLLAKPVKTPDDLDTISRNVEHLKIMVGKDNWTTEDLTPFQTAITAGS